MTPMSMADLPPEEIEILRARARALARPEASRDEEGEVFVGFTLARERYVVEARYVHAAFRLRQLARIPGATPPVVAVTRWRGDVLTLLDVRPLVGAPASALDDLAVVIIIGVDRPEFGLLADTLEGSAPLAADQILPPPTRRAAPGEVDAVRGVTRDARLVLDAPALIARQTASIEQPSRPPIR